jgi:hypothetical protein
MRVLNDFLIWANGHFSEIIEGKPVIQGAAIVSNAKVTLCHGRMRWESLRDSSRIRLSFNLQNGVGVLSCGFQIKVDSLGNILKAKPIDLFYFHGRYLTIPSPIQDSVSRNV